MKKSNTRYTVVPVIALVTVLVTFSAASAQTNCANRDTVINKLQSGYGEAFAGGGLQNSERIIEVWFSEEKGTWTILMTKADGKSCIMASGTNWREGLPSDKPIPGEPS